MIDLAPFAPVIVGFVVALGGLIAARRIRAGLHSSRISGTE